MIIIEEDIIIKPRFDFKKTVCKNIFDRSFWDMKQTYIKGVQYGYSKRTRLVFALHIINGERKMQVIGMKKEDKKITPISNCDKDVRMWCKKLNLL